MTHRIDMSRGVQTRGNLGLSCVAAAVTLALAGGAGSLNAAEVAADAPEQLLELEQVVVTGSRIQVTGMQTPTPVTAISADDLLTLAPTTLVEALVQLPQFLNSDTPQSQGFGSSGASGASFINLRGVGANRTLTLLDGRRVTPATRTGAVDISLLPETLVRRVDVVTGGASAAYGSDAVSGVVNFILDTSLTGVKASVQGGITEVGDNENYKANIAWGTRIGDRAHLVASAEYYEAAGIKGYNNRSWFNSWGYVNNPAYTSTNGQPQRLVAPNVRSSTYNYGGLITTGPLAGTTFLPDGSPVLFDRGNYYSSASQQGGSGIDPAATETWIMPDQERLSAFAHLKVDLTDNLRGFVQFVAGNSESYFEKDAANMTSPWTATIYRDNAFLPAELGAVMDTATGLAAEQFTFSRLASSADLGGGHVTNTSKMRSGTIGLDGRINNDWSWNTYYQYGKNNAVLYYTNTARIDRLFRAVDVVRDGSGRIVCRSTLSFPTDGCVPMNIFGEGAPSPEAVNYVNGDASDQDQEIVQQVAEFTVSGKPWNGWAGPISMASGVSWRKETLNNTPNRYPNDLMDFTSVPTAASQGYKGLPAQYSGQLNLFERTIFTTLSGKYNVREAFVETLVPLLADQPGVQRLDFSGAFRWADYSGSGGIPAWKLGLDWQVVDTLRVRATASRDVRAGTLSERFDWSGAGATINDYTQPTATLPYSTYTITQVRGGNPEIDPELADTLTFGFVWQPIFLEGFSLSADYYDIKIKDAIAQPGVQYVFDECFAGATAMCDRITRSTDTGNITAINATYVNLAQARARGVDVELGYRRPITLFGGGESISFRALTSYAAENSRTNIGAPKIDSAGVNGGGGTPELQAQLGLSYQRDDFSLSLQTRYTKRGLFNVNWVEGVDIDDNTVGGVVTTNLRAAYDFGRDSARYTVFLNVTNLFDRDPPRAPSFGFNGSNHTNESLYDVLGRRYTLGLNMKL